MPFASENLGVGAARVTDARARVTGITSPAVRARSSPSPSAPGSRRRCAYALATCAAPAGDTPVRTHFEARQGCPARVLEIRLSSTTTSLPPDRLPALTPAAHELEAAAQAAD